MKFSEYKAVIKPHLSDYRYRHSINVAEQAVHLAKLYGADPQKAQIAGILHDIMKDTDPSDQLKIIERSGIILTDVEKSAPKLWHAISGAAYLEQELDIHDKDILDAVRYHTTGRAGMSLLEIVIFIADFTSAERDYDGAEEMKKAAERDLDEAMLRGVTFTITDLAKRHKSIHPDTLSTYNWVVLKKVDSVK